MEKEKSFEQVISEMMEEDLIHQPNHYKGKNGMEVIDVIKNFAPCPEYAEGFFFGNVVKYALRHSQKNGLEDLKKSPSLFRLVNRSLGGWTWTGNKLRKLYLTMKIY